MATLEDIVAASKILSEDSDPVTGNLDCEPKENQDGASKIVSAVDAVVEGDVSADVSEQNVETETVVEGDVSAALSEQDMAIETVVDGGVSAADAVVREQNVVVGTVVHSGVSCAVVSEQSMEIETVVDGGVSVTVVSERSVEIETVVDGGVSAAVVSEQNVETETVVAAVVSEQNVETETVVDGGVSSTDAVVSKQNVEPETVVDGGVSSAGAVVSEQNVEPETVVDSGVSPADAVVSEQNVEPETVVSEQNMETETVVSEQNMETETVEDGGVSAADVVVSEQTVEFETVVDDGGSAANAVVSKQNMVIETVADGSVSAAVTEQNVETVTAVESTFDDEKEKVGIKTLSPVPNNSSSKGVNGVDVGVDADDSKEELVSGENNAFLENSFTESGEDKYTDYMDVDGGEGNNGKLKDSENVFHVGDFVWAKIRSHPWWPGQVYDSKDASEFAMKRKQEGRLLVAFFGDGTCSWCLPSQLIPFVANFSEMSTDSSSKSFLNAVEKALDEVSRFVESDMTCKCTSKEKIDSLVPPVVENAGLKTGVVVPDIDASRLSLPKFEPTEVVEKVMQLAKTVCTDSALDLAIVRSLLSAFYYHKGGYQMPVYHVPSHIEGLEDKSKNVNEAGNDFSVPIEVPIGPQDDDDWISSPAVGSVDPQVSHKRKQKSVAELMRENKNIKPKSRTRGSVKEGADSETPLSSLKKKTKKDGADSEIPLSLLKKKNKKDGEVGIEGASSTGKKGRKRKVEEILESPKLTNVKDSNADGVNGRTLVRKPKGIEVAVAENVSNEAKEETEMDMVSSPRERKKSKYLSPPYTNVSWRMGVLSPRTELRQKEALEAIFASKSSEEKLSNGNASEDKSPDAVKNNQELSFPVSDVDVPVNELLSDIELASRDPLYLTKTGSLEKVCAFASALRSSINLHGENYEIYGKGKAAGEQKSHKLSKKSNTSKSKKAAETCVGGSTMVKAEGTTSPCLILQFTAEVPLPSKKDIIKLFDKFGSLNKKETKVDDDSHSIRVVFKNDPDAEAAFKSSLNESPFPLESVNYRLQRSSPIPKKRRSSLNASSPPKRAPEEREASGPTDDLVLDFDNIRQKLEITTAIVKNYHGKFSGEDKSSLKDEMKRLMEEVEVVSEKVRVMAEKTSEFAGAEVGK